MKLRIFIYLIFSLKIISGQNLPNDCVNFIQICDNQSVSFNVSGAGVQEIFQAECSSYEHNSIWFKVTIEQAGTFNFTIIPTDTDITEDFDFWVFGPNSDCSNLGISIRCSTTNPQAAGSTSNHTGLNSSSTDTSEGPGPNGDNFVRELDVLAGESYFIVVDRPIGNSPFSIEWGGSAVIQNPFANINFPNGNNFPMVELCDDGNNGTEPYDFSELTLPFLGSLPAFTISYFQNELNATLNNFPLIGTNNISPNIYYARIESDNSDCFLIKPIQVIFENLTTNDVSIQYCDDIVGAFANYDLSLQNNSVYTGNQIVNYEYYLSLIDAQNEQFQIPDWENRPLILGLNTFYVRVKRGSCFDISILEIDYIKIPFVNTYAELKQCDTDTDGYSVFNLYEANDFIMSNSNDLTITFFRYQADAQNNANAIVNATNFVNETINFQTLYYRINNLNDCFVKIGQLDIIVSATQIPITFTPLNFTSCDDTYGTNNDGIAMFDFSSAQLTMANVFVGQNIEVSFYETEFDALSELNEITNTTNYNNFNSLNLQEVYVRIENDLNNECLGIGKYVILEVESNPIIQPLTKRLCDDDGDGQVSFNTTNITNEILNGLTNVTITYTDSLNNVYSNLPNPLVTGNQFFTVNVTNNTSNACQHSSSLTFIIDQKPIANPIPLNLLMSCDDEPISTEQDGWLSFDTSNFENLLKGVQTNVEISFCDLNDVLINNFIGSFNSNTRTIKARVSLIDNPDCFDEILLNFIVHQNPIIRENEIVKICIDQPSAIVNLDAGLLQPAFANQYSYKWYFNDDIITNANQYLYTTNQIGNYKVELTSNESCVSTREIIVSPSNKPTIDRIDIIDLLDINTITIYVSGFGNYVYSIDGVNYQVSNVIYTSEFGEITVYVKDLFGCGIYEEKIVLLSIPKFFTPNNDGINDYWQIKGFNLKYKDEVIVSIYDRYGKLIKQLNAFKGWDGTYNENELPSNDYWYKIDLPNGKSLKGYFSLKR